LGRDASIRLLKIDHFSNFWSLRKSNYVTFAVLILVASEMGWSRRRK
jgi:hypothetical protein